MDIGEEQDLAAKTAVSVKGGQRTGLGRLGELSQQGYHSGQTLLYRPQTIPSESYQPTNRLHNSERGCWHAGRNQQNILV